MNFVSNFSAIGTAFFCVKLAGSQSFHQRKDFSRKEITLEQLVLMGITDAKSMIRTVNKRIVSTFMVLFRLLTILYSSTQNPTGHLGGQ